MNKLFLTQWITVILFVFTIQSCEKTTDVNNQCFTIKYIDGMCYTNIYQILDPNFYHLGQNNWVCPRDGRTYSNVFVLKNYCTNLGVQTDSTARVRITANASASGQNCIVCLAAYINPPTKQLELKGCE